MQTKYVLSKGDGRFLIGDQEVVGLIPTGSGNILSERLIMKYFLQSFSPLG